MSPSLTCFLEILGDSHGIRVVISKPTAEILDKGYEIDEAIANVEFGSILKKELFLETFTGLTMSSLNFTHAGIEMTGSKLREKAKAVRTSNSRALFLDTKGG